jgi:hypothetical protein
MGRQAWVTGVPINARHHGPVTARPAEALTGATLCGLGQPFAAINGTERHPSVIAFDWL